MLGDPADWTVVSDHLLTCASRALVLLLGAWSLLFAQDGKNLRVVDHIHTPTLLRIISVGRGPANTKQLGRLSVRLCQAVLALLWQFSGKAPAGDMASFHNYSRLLAKREKKSLPTFFLLDVCRGRTARLCTSTSYSGPTAGWLGVILGSTQNSYTVVLIKSTQQYNVSYITNKYVLCTKFVLRIERKKVSFAPHTPGPGRF